MWKILNNGDTISVGDTIRFRPKSNVQTAQSEIYLVAKTEQHYFELIKKPDARDRQEEPQRLAVRLIDIGYNLLLDRWSERIDGSVAC